MKPIRMASLLVLPLVVAAIGLLPPAAQSSAGANEEEEELVLDDGTRLVLVSEKSELIAYTGPSGDKVTEWGVVSHYAPPGTPLDAMLLSCTVDYSNSVPSRLPIPTFPITYKAYASSTLTVSAGCSAGVTWNHRLYRLSNPRGTNYSATVQPGHSDEDGRFSNCSGITVGTWSNRVNGGVMTSANLACS